MSAQIAAALKFDLGTTLQTAVAITAISNANPGIVSAASHAMATGDFGLFQSGWSKLDNRVVRASTIVAGVSFALEGINTTNTSNYPVAGGTGTYQEISAFTRITEVLDLQMTGGEQQAQSYQFVDEEQEFELATFINAQRITMTITDDTTKAGYIALKAASEAGTTYPLKLTTRTGAIVCYSGTVHLNESPKISKNDIIGCECLFLVKGLAVRYAS